MSKYICKIKSKNFLNKIKKNVVFFALMWYNLIVYKVEVIYFS